MRGELKLGRFIGQRRQLVGQRNMSLGFFSFLLERIRISRKPEQNSHHQHGDGVNFRYCAPSQRHHNRGRDQIGYRRAGVALARRGPDRPAFDLTFWAGSANMNRARRLGFFSRGLCVDGLAGELRTWWKVIRLVIRASL